MEKLEKEKICRICLVEEKTSGSENYLNLFSVCSPQVFFYCTSLQIVEGDGLPELICRQCLDLFNRFYDFKCLVIRSDETLRSNLYLKIKSENTTEIIQFNNKSTGSDFNIPTKKTSPLPKYNYNTDSVLSNNYNDDGNLLESISDKTSKTTKKSRAKKKEKCSLCHKKYSNPGKLEMHMKSHFQNENVGVKKYICHKCGVKFVQAENLRSHLLHHTQDKVYACNHCGKKFIQSGNLKTHLIRHTGVKNVACALCNMQFYVKGDLDKHMRSHSDDKPYNCITCGKAFKTQSFLLIHNRTHTGVRPFACDLCPKKFMSRKDLKNHRMTHTGEKPHKCQMCQQAFIQKCALNRHMKIHEKSQAHIT